MPAESYVVYCDESSKKGPYFSNFYGGALIRATDQQRIELLLNQRKTVLNLHSEIKWTKITEAYEVKYVEFIDTFFSLIKSGDIKIRIMFTQNVHQPVGLTPEQIENSYFLLYYQLLKHAFGLQHCSEGNRYGATVRLLLDQIPDTIEKTERFKDFLCRIGQTEGYADANVRFPRDQIGSVQSHDHVILQGLDIILGAMHFRLNDLHRAIPDGKKRRGKRTRAKERVFQTISRHIREIYPNFNIGNSTGHGGDNANRWRHPYRHWLFVPQNRQYDETKVKPR